MAKGRFGLWLNSLDESLPNLVTRGQNPREKVVDFQDFSFVL
jgi:hypothetical protein